MSIKKKWITAEYFATDSENKNQTMLRCLKEATGEQLKDGDQAEEKMVTCKCNLIIMK